MIIVGVRLEKAIAHSALVVVRRHERLAGDFDTVRKRWPTVVDFDVPHLERFPKGARYSDIVDELSGLIGQLSGKPMLLVDMTVTGRPPVQAMAARRLRPWAVQVVESGRPHKAHRALHVPRSELVSTLSIVMGQDRISVGDDLPDATALVSQLEAYPASKPDADDPVDLATACALAVWWGTHRARSQIPQPPPPRNVPKLKGLNEMTFDEVLALDRR